MVKVNVSFALLINTIIRSYFYDLDVLQKLSTKYKDKRNDFDFLVVDYSFLIDSIQDVLIYRASVLQLINFFSNKYYHYRNHLNRPQQLEHGYVVNLQRPSLQKMEIL